MPWRGSIGKTLPCFDRYSMARQAAIHILHNSHATISPWTDPVTPTPLASSSTFVYGYIPMYPPIPEYTMTPMTLAP